MPLFPNQIQLRDPVNGTALINRILHKELGMVGLADSIALVEKGLLNFVYRVEAGDQIFFFKQALAKPKSDTAKSLLRTLSPRRIYFESQLLQKLHPILADDVKLPKAFYYDPANNILVIEDICSDHGVVMDELLIRQNFTFGNATGRNVGANLALLHSSSLNKKNIVRGEIEEDFTLWKKMLFLRTKDVAANLTDQNLIAALHALYFNSSSNGTVDILSLNDLCPKNIVELKDSKVGFFDFELASGIGDPAYDLGFYLGHLFIAPAGYQKATVEWTVVLAVIEGYLKVFDVPHADRFLNRVARFIGATILYRMCGASRDACLLPDSGESLTKAAQLLLLDSRAKVAETLTLLHDAWIEAQPKHPSATSDNDDYLLV